LTEPALKISVKLTLLCWQQHCSTKNGALKTSVDTCAISMHKGHLTSPMNLLTVLKMSSILRPMMAPDLALIPENLLVEHFTYTPLTYVVPATGRCSLTQPSACQAMSFALRPSIGKVCGAVVPVARLSQRTTAFRATSVKRSPQIRAMSAQSDTKLDKNTPDSKWKEILSAEEVRNPAFSGILRCMQCSACKTASHLLSDPCW